MGATAAGGLEVGQVVVRDADRPDLPGVAQVEQRPDRLLGGHPGHGPVHLVQVDPVQPQRLEAAVAGHPQVVPGGLPPDPERGIGLPGHPALGGHDHLVAPLARDPPHDPLGAPLAVDVGRVDPVDPGVDGRVAGRERRLVVGASPPAAEHPRAQPDDRQLEIRPAQPPPLHATPPGPRSRRDPPGQPTSA